MVAVTSSQSIIGIGLLKGLRAVRWATVRDMVLAWIVTLPASGTSGGTGLCRLQSATLERLIYCHVSEAEVGPDAVGGHGRKIRFCNEAEGYHWRSDLGPTKPFVSSEFPEVHSSVR